MLKAMKMTPQNVLHLRFGAETQFAVNSRYVIVIIFLSNTMDYTVIIIVIS